MLDEDNDYEEFTEEVFIDYPKLNKICLRRIRVFTK